MSSDQIAISVRGLGKSYRIGQKTVYSTAAEAALAWMRNPFRGETTEQMWALQDVNFEVPRGNVVGLLGRNGAGKSTLLKILSRITAPTTGEIRIAGRVASLIEVGTGFQPELTGRENIYLNGAILGMRRRTITERFDEIVDFSGVEKFLDTPVKRYSSGMYVRLAFAVAAHLDADILLVDEVLSVGDAEFQKKSLGKMEAVASAGRTVIFVSHDMAALESLCDTGIIFQNGRMLEESPIQEALLNYHRTLSTLDTSAASQPIDLGHDYRYFRSIDMLDENGRSTRTMPMGGQLRVRISAEADEPVEFPNFRILIDNTRGQRVLALRTPRSENAIRRLDRLSEVTCNVDPLPLAPGEYVMRFSLCKGLDPIENVEQELTFTVRNADTFGDGWGGREVGHTIAPSTWEVVEVSEGRQTRLSA